MIKRNPLVLILLYVVLAGPAFASEYFVKLRSNDEKTLVFREIERLVKVEAGDYKIKIDKAFVTLTESGLDRIYVLELPEKIQEVTLKRISTLEGIEYIELVPDYQFDYTPNDYNTSVMWHLNKVKALNAWDLERGGDGIIVALVDDGMDTAHPDLQPALWHNTKEIKGNGIDDDLNLYIDDYFGWDVADNDNDPCVVASNNLTHGTHCAGIIGARTDNNIGISGIGFNIKIMPLKCGKVGQAGVFNGYKGVEYAIRNGARVISMSWSGPNYSATYQTLFDVAFKKNIVCVAAAGNDSNDFQNYPAAYDHVIAVGNTNSSDVMHFRSNYGTWVDLVAPGTSIYSTLPGNTYGYKSGTSMACPLVAGLCALMISRNPAITNVELESCLKSACENIDAQNPGYVGLMGSGRINAFNAMKCVKPVVALFRSSKKFVCTGDTMRYFDQSIPSVNSWLWNFENGTPAVSSSQNPIVRYTTSGVFKVKLTVVKGSDTDYLEMLNYVTVGKPTVKFSGVQTINRGDFGTIRADLTGAAPWTLVYTDGKKQDTIRNIQNNPYFILKVPDSTKIYKPLAISSGTCAGTVRDSTRINVIQDVFTNCDSSLRYHMTFGGTGDDQANSIASFKDTILYIAGRTNSNAAGSYDAFLAKVNASSGKLVWYKTYGGTNDDGFFTVVVDARENIYCGGFTHSNVTNRAAMMVKFDKSGNVKWRRYYHGSTHEYIYKAVLSKKNDFVYFTGHSAFNGFGSSDYTVYKFDTLGTVKWVKQLGTANQERPYGMMADDSGNVYLMGLATIITNNPTLFKLDVNGNIKFSKYYSDGGSTAIEYMDAALWDSKTLYLVGRILGSGSTRTILSKMDVNGNISWTKDISFGSQSWPKINIAGGKIIVGDFTTISSKNHGLFYVLDSNGNVLKVRQVTASGSVNINNFIMNKDFGIHYVGYQNISNNQICVGRTNCEMNNLCLFNNVSASVANLTMTATKYSISSQDFTNSTSPNHTAVSQTYSAPAFVCRSTVTFIPKTTCNLGADFSMSAECTGDTTDFTDLSLDTNGHNIDGWFWDFDDGYTASGMANPRHVYAAEGIYLVKLIVKSTGNGKSCTDTIIKPYMSSDSFRIVSMQRDTTICLGDSIKPAKPLSTCGNPPYYYEWTPTIGVDDPSLAQPHFSPKVNTVYKLQMTDYDGRITKQDSFKIVVDKMCCKSQARFKTDREFICMNDSVRFINTSTYDDGSFYFLWKFTGANISSYVGKNPPPVVFNTYGKKKVELILSDICSNDTLVTPIFVYRLPIAEAGRDTMICDPMDTLNIGGESFGMNMYKWTPASGLSNPNLSDPVAIVSSDVSYKVTVTDVHGCVNRDSVNIINRSVNLFISGDTAYCSGDSLKLQMSTPGTYLWNTNDTSRSISVKTPGIYWGEVTAGCIARDTVVITEYPTPVFDLGRDTVFCEGKSLRLESPIAGVYLWNNGSNKDSLRVTAPGTYWLKVSLGKCSSVDSIVVAEKPSPVIGLGKDTFFCKGNSVKLGSSAAGIHLWSTGSNADSIVVNKTGLYWLKVTLGDCIAADSVVITEQPLPVFELGNVRVICRDSILLRPSVNFPNSKYLWNTGSNKDQILVKSPGTYALSISDKNNCNYTDSVLARQGLIPGVDIKDIFKCEDIKYLLTLTQVPGQTYFWSDSTNGPVRTFLKPGNYWVKAKTECGDTTVNFRVVDSGCICNVFVPTVFSPNGDSKNDIFRVYAQCNLLEYKMQVFNRWGEMVFESQDTAYNWDGNYKNTIVPQGVYFYKIEFRKDLPNFKQFVSMKGSVLLME